MIGNRVPVTILTGFLGTGKTTLIRSILERANGRHVAVVVNEFGDIGFDGGLIEDSATESCRPGDVVELTNGCICCTVADDFIPTMDRLLSRDRPLDAIVIETSGLALPQPLLKAFTWPSVRTRATVAGVVTVVDASAFAEGRMAFHDHAAPDDPARAHDDPVEEVFDDQLACADLVILSKSDLVSPEALVAIEANLREELRPSVRIVRSASADLAPEILIGLSAAAENDLAARAGHHGAEDEHDHDDFESFVLASRPWSDAVAVETAIRTALAVPGVLRIKGHVAVAGKPAPLVVQAVGTRVELAFARPGAIRQNGLVVIGLRGLDRAAVAAVLMP